MKFLISCILAVFLCFMLIRLALVLGFLGWAAWEINHDAWRPKHHQHYRY